MNSDQDEEKQREQGRAGRWLGRVATAGALMLPLGCGEQKAPLPEKAPTGEVPFVEKVRLEEKPLAVAKASPPSLVHRFEKFSTKIVLPPGATKTKIDGIYDLPGGEKVITTEFDHYWTLGAGADLFVVANGQVLNGNMIQSKESGAKVEIWDRQTLLATTQEASLHFFQTEKEAQAYLRGNELKR